MVNLQDILSILSGHKSLLFAKYKIRRMAIFGSVSRRTNTENSDIDVLVEFDEKIGIEFVDLAEELETIIGKKVDLVSKNGIKEEYFKSISSDLVYV